MVGLLKLVGVILATVLGLALFTQYEPDRLESVSRLWGYPLIAIAQGGPRGLIAIGQVGATGVLVVAQAGFGLVTFAQGGVGLIFGLGQLQVGLVVIAQLGLGLLFFFGQVGLGAQALGQAAFRSPGTAYFKEMSAEFNELLSFRGKQGAGLTGR